MKRFLLLPSLFLLSSCVASPVAQESGVESRAISGGAAAGTAANSGSYEAPQNLAPAPAPEMYSQINEVQFVITDDEDCETYRQEVLEKQDGRRLRWTGKRPNPNRSSRHRWVCIYQKLPDDPYYINGFSSSKNDDWRGKMGR